MKIELMDKGRDTEFSRLHPWVNFLYLAGVLVITIISTNPIMLAIAFIFSFVYSVMCCGIKIIGNNLRVFIPISIFTLIVQPIFSHNGSTPLFYINENAVTLETLIYGGMVSVLLFSTIQWFNCYNKIISSDKFLYLFGRVVPSLALVVSMIFRMIPLLKYRFKEIDEAQMALGRKGKDEGFFNWVKVFIKELSILISWSLEASIDTADSMESRGYGLKGRTSFHLYKWSRKDSLWGVFILCFICICMFGILEKSVQVYYFPTFYMKEMSGISIVTIFSFIILGSFPIIYDLGGMLKWKQ